MANYYNDTENSAAQKQQASIRGELQGQTPQSHGYVHEVSLLEEAQNFVKYHQEEAEKASKAANFLQSHPEFEQFIKLLRSGAIQF